MEEQIELLFFDTFSHEASEEINLDLVQFPKPVLVGEVRIIPLGARVQADFPGGVRLGATNPSQFEIEFFVNDLSKPGASTFEKLGNMDYNQNGNIHLDCEHKVATDGLVLRGRFTTITLAIYGTLAKAPPEPPPVEPAVQSQPVQPPQAVPQPTTWQNETVQQTQVQTPVEFEAKTNFESQDSWDSGRDRGECHTPSSVNKQWSKQYQSGDSTRTPTPTYRGARSPPGEYNERDTPEYDSIRPREPPVDRLSRPPSPPTPPPPSKEEEGVGQLSPGSVESISEGDIPMEEEQQATFDPLTDDDDFTQDMDFEAVAGMGDIVNSNEPLITIFDPATFQVKPLQWFKNPVKCKEECKTVESEKLSDTVNSLSKSPCSTQLWIDLAEQLLNVLPTFLSNLDVEEKLVSIITEGLEWKYNDVDAVTDEDNTNRSSSVPRQNEEEPVLKVRSLKLSLRLCEAVVFSSCSVAVKLVKDHDVLATLFKLYHMEWMALSLKLLILRAIDCLLQYEECLKHVTALDSHLSCYQRLIKLLQQGDQHARINFSIASILAKIHFYHLCLEIQQIVQSFKGKDELEDDKCSSLCLCLEELLNMYRSAPRIFSKPKRFLPVSSVFEAPQDSNDPRLDLYSYFNLTNFIPNLISILNCFKDNQSLRTNVLLWIDELSKSNHGLIYLSFEKEIDKLLSDLSNYDLKLCYQLRTLQLLDDLAISNDIDNFTTIDHLHCISSLLLNTDVGKNCVLDVITYSDNLSILFDLLVKKSIYKKKSPARGYIIDLIIMIVKSNLDVGYLKAYASKIVELSKGDFVELKEIAEGLKPCLVKDPFDYSNISPICDFVKNNVESCTNLSIELLTAVRILRYLATDDYNTIGSFTELKYKYVLLQIYSVDGLSDLNNILNKLCKKFDPIMGDASPGKRSQAITLMVPVIELIKKLLSEVISCRGSDFKDMTCVTTLLDAYQMLSIGDSEEALVCRQYIVDSLLAYTQGFDPSSPAKSAWCLMITQVVNWLSDTPRQINRGLSILNQLLPLPLPVLTCQNLTEEEISRCVSHRRAWAAVLAPTSLPALLTALTHTSHHITAELVYTVSFKYSDLAAPSALALVRALLETQHTAKSIQFLSLLSSHPPVKAALLQTLEPEIWTPLLENHLTGLLPCVEALCNYQISLSRDKSNISSNVPSPRIISATVGMIVSALQRDSLDCKGVLSCLKILKQLCQHDYGFYHCYKSLDLESGWCYKLLENTNTEVTKSVIELGLMMGSIDNQNQSCRTQTLSPNCLRSLFKFNDLQDHPLQKIKDNEEMNIDINTFIKLFDKEDSTDSIPELVEVEESGEAMLSQFSTRNVFKLINISSTQEMCGRSKYELSSDDSSQQVGLDIGEILKIDLKGWDLNKALSEMSSKPACRSLETSSVSHSHVPSHPQSKTATTTSKPIFVGGSGRGNMRGGIVDRGGDMFRSRAANTSRPPSLHVDDFVALETHGAQPTGPTGYNKLSMMAAQDILGMRGPGPVVMRGGRPPHHVERNPRYHHIQPYLPPHYPVYYPPHPPHPHF